MKGLAQIVLLVVASLSPATAGELVNVDWQPAQWDGKYGFVDKTGVVMLPFQYEKADPFSEGLAAVKINNKWGYTDPWGNLVIKPDFYYASIFQRGMAIIRINEHNGLIDKRGRYLLPPVFDDLASEAGFTKLRVLGKVGLINFETGFFISPRFKGIRFPHDGLIAFADAHWKWGYLDEKGNRVIEAQFLDAQDFSEGLAAVTLLRDYGYIDKGGNWIIKPQFIFPGDFKNGKAIVGIRHFGIFLKFDEGRLKVERQQFKFGVIDNNGNFILPMVYDYEDLKNRF